MRIISGPCQHESLEHSTMIANECQRVCGKYNFDYIFKASFDKANRSSNSGKRGVGLKQTMRDFRSMKDNFDDLPILTDVHTVGQIQDIQDLYSDCVDVLQIPAFLCRQTDLLLAAYNTDKIVNIKKGQFLAPWDMKGILSKLPSTDDVWITERGTSFGYNTLVVDFTGLRFMLDNYDVPVVMDATHAVQKPGGLGGSSGGNRDYAPHMAACAAAIGVTNFFLEVHEDPDNAPSDGPNMIHLKDFEKTVERLYNIVKATRV